MTEFDDVHHLSRDGERPAIRCAELKTRIPHSKTEIIRGDAHLTAFINASDFLEEEDEEEIPDPPDEGQCQ